MTFAHSSAANIKQSIVRNALRFADRQQKLTARLRVLARQYSLTRRDGGDSFLLRRRALSIFCPLAAITYRLLASLEPLQDIAAVGVWPEQQRSHYLTQNLR
ncbi:MAG: hypothetical protein QNJ46_27820 [Leptolyngbyaceae cyanobacterium MO_188.B28]|nr:hypothetical protein [Leptolyngbyaceae cyanobacterium MO_188.B28]